MVKPSVLETRTRKKSCKIAQLNGKRAQRIPSWPGVLLQQRPYTFAQTNLSIHFSLAAERRTIHSESLVIEELVGAESCDARFLW